MPTAGNERDSPASREDAAGPSDAASEGSASGADAGHGAVEGDRALLVEPLLDAVDAADADTRRRAAHALVALAAESDRAQFLAGRLLDRLPEADHGRALVRTLAHLADDPAVAPALDTAPERVRRAVAASDGWSFDARPDGGAAALVRAAVEGEGSADGRGGPPGADPPGEVSAGDDGDAATAGADARADSAALDRRERIRRIAESRLFSAIAMDADFDELSVVEPEQAVRYGSAVRTRATVDGEERGVAVRLFDRADPGEPRRQFAAHLAERLAAWAGADDHPAVLPVHDWGADPRPWVATPYVEGSLTDRGRVGTERALQEAIGLARGVEHLHENGVVHAGIGPAAVVYPDASLDGLPAPRLDNVGLLAAVREQFDPADYLDPRYAAPEYFTTRYGSVDAATDVYQLGAVVFRLLTGRPPVTAEGSVREAVLERQPPTPGDAADLPSVLEPVLAKALARPKLTRYESATALRADLEAALDDLA